MMRIGALLKVRYDNRGLNAIAADCGAETKQPKEQPDLLPW
jgi:hypothetical protein